MRPILIAMFLIAALHGADAGAPAADATVVTVDRLTLADGKQLVGRYDRAAGTIALVSEKTGKQVGELAVAPDQVAKVETIELTVSVQAPTGANGRWLTNYTKARELAKKLKRPLLIDFTGSDWCGWCVKLEAEVFTKKEFQTWAKERVVLLKLDFPRKDPLPPSVAAVNAKLAQQYAVTGYPTVLVVDPESEKTLRKWGYFAGGPKAWVEGMLLGVEGLDMLAWVEAAPAAR